MSYQGALCSRIIKVGPAAMSTVLKWGITEADFTTEETKSCWSLLLSYWSKNETRGSVITDGQLERWFHDWQRWDDMSHVSLEGLCSHVRRERFIVEANTAMAEFSGTVSVPLVDPLPAAAALHQSLGRIIALGTAAQSDVPFHIGLNNILYKIKQAEAGIDLSRMKWPWDALQNATFGLQPDDYIVLYGRPKSMKSWILCYLIAWAFEQGLRVLVYTKEMVPDNIYMRALACMGLLVYSDLRAATSAQAYKDPSRLSSIAYVKQMLESMDFMIKHNPVDKDRLVVLSGRDVGAGNDTVAWLGSKVDQYKPDVLFVDGLYLLSDGKKASRDNDRVMGISRATRDLVLASGVPVIATMQANRKAAGHTDANLDEIAFSDALAQDATIAARIINDKKTPTISVVLGGSREFKLHGFRTNAVPACDFTFHSELSEQDVQKAKEGDQAESDKKPKKDAVRPPGKGRKNGPTESELTQKITEAAAAVNA